jgi:hypothetical protein
VPLVAGARASPAQLVVAERLLAHHTGDMPADLVFLPYLHLLDPLSDPQQVPKTS